MSRRSNDRRWESKFGRFVREYGVARLAARLNVTPAAVYLWISGKTRPQTGKAIEICQIARPQRLSIEEIYRHSRPA